MNDAALLGGPPVDEIEWPRWPLISRRDRAIEALGEVLDSTCWTARSAIARSRLPDLEKRWAELHGASHALLVSSGSAALELALRGLEIGVGDQVLVPALGWYATAAAASRVGAEVVFFDIDPASSCGSIEDARSRLTTATRALLLVHLHCSLADLPAFRSFCDGAGIALIEDAAQAHGAHFQGCSAGSWGDVGCFSFNQEKTLPLGEGGALVVRDEQLYRRLYGLRTDGYLPFTDRPGGEVQAANYCLSELQAALLPGQLEAFEELEARRQDVAARLERSLADVPGLRALTTAEGTTRRPYYEFGLVFEDLGAWGDWPLDLLARALTADTGIDLHRTDAPVPTCPQFAPHPDEHLPVPSAAAELHRRLLVFHHRYLLDTRLTDVLLRALVKVHRLANSHPAERFANAGD